MSTFLGKNTFKSANKSTFKSTIWRSDYTSESPHGPGPSALAGFPVFSFQSSAFLSASPPPVFFCLSTCHLQPLPALAGYNSLWVKNGLYNRVHQNSKKFSKSHGLLIYVVPTWVQAIFFKMVARWGKCKKNLFLQKRPLYMLVQNI